MNQVSRPHRRGLRFVAACAAALVATVWAGALPATAATDVISPGDENGWAGRSAYCGDEGASTGSQTFENGPGEPPAGQGSREFRTGADGNSFEEYRLSTFDGTPIAAIDEFTYWTFVEESFDGQQAPYLIINVDTDNDGTTDEQLFFEPVYQQEAFGGTQPVLAEDVWQEWDAANGQWTVGPFDNPETTPFTTLAAYAAADPGNDAVVSTEGTFGGIRVATGCGAGSWDNFVGNVDLVTITTAGDEQQRYDFEAVAPAAPPPGDDDDDEPEYTEGYRLVAADGGIFTFGDRRFHGSTGDIKLNKPIVGGATDLSDYDGYWIVASDGGVFTFNAEFHGSLADRPNELTSPAVEIEPTPSGKGYWIVLADGKVFAFGDAKHFGDFGGNKLNAPVIGMSVTGTGLGYWLVAEDGGIFSFGDADFHGSMGGQRLNAPVIDLAPAVDNNGYYLVAEDGGVFAFGSAEFKGSTGDIKLNDPVVAMLVAPNGAGYWLGATDGGVFTFGTVNFLGSMGGTPLNSPVLDMIH